MAELGALALALLVRARLRRHDRWSRGQIIQHQDRALRRLREFAHQHSPFYASFHKGRERSPLGELPVLTKSVLMDQFDALVTDRAVRRNDVEAYLKNPSGGTRFRGRYVVSATAGTTRQPGIFLAAPSEWAYVMGSYARATDWAGVSVGPWPPRRLAVVASRKPWHQSARVGQTTRSAFLPTLQLDANDPLPDIVARLNAFRPHHLIAYAGMAGILAKEQIDGRLAIHPRAVFCASEVLSAASRARIAAAWGHQPFNVYAATETAGIASECRLHRGLHLYEDLVIVEVVDERNRSVPAGISADKILVTVLFSRTQPLIRYEMSDRVTLSPSPCACGRAFAFIESVDGRAEDVLELPAANGSTVSVHPVLFHQLLEVLPVHAWQVRQGDAGLEILLERPAPGVSMPAVEMGVRHMLRRMGAPDMSIEVRLVDAIERTALGKRKTFVRHAALRHGPAASPARRPGE